MKLLYDQNLPRSLVKSLADLFPDSQHVYLLGMHRAEDEAIWAYAAQYGLVVASKDFDFHERAKRLGPPPKVLWLDCGNCPPEHIEQLLRDHFETIRNFAVDDEAEVLVIR